MNEGCDNRATWAGEGKNAVDFFFIIILKGKIDSRCVEIPFQKDGGCVANEQATGFEKKKKKHSESSNIKRSRRQKEGKKRSPDEVCIDCAMELSVF